MRQIYYHKNFYKFIRKSFGNETVSNLNNWKKLNYDIVNINLKIFFLTRCKRLNIAPPFIYNLVRNNKLFVS